MSGILAALDRLLTPTRVDYLRADLQIMRKLSDRPPGSYQIENLPAELRRVTPRRSKLLALWKCQA